MVRDPAPQRLRPTRRLWETIRRRIPPANLPGLARRPPRALHEFCTAWVFSHCYHPGASSRSGEDHATNVLET